MRSVYVPVTQQTTNILLHDALKRSAVSVRAREALIAVLQEHAGRRRIAVVDHYRDTASVPACRSISLSARHAARSAIELSTTVLFTTRQRHDPQVIMAAPMLTREGRAWGALVTIGASACFAPSAARVLEQAAHRIACLLPAGWKAPAVAHNSPLELQMAEDMSTNIATDALIHELRAPLSAAGFALERLRSLMPTGEDALREQSMATASTGIAEAHNVVRWFQHLRSAQLQPDIRHPLSAEEAISTAMTLLVGNSLQLSVLIPGDFPLVMADFIGLTHIFTNLLDNAIHHTCPPHQVMIEGWQQEPGVAQIAVTSSGSGIPSEQRQTLFQPYGGQQPTGQHGMGLAVAQYLAMRMEGYLRVESDGETFTTFTLTLPACESDTAAQPQEE